MEGDSQGQPAGGQFSNNPTGNGGLSGVGQTQSAVPQQPEPIAVPNVPASSNQVYQPQPVIPSPNSAIPDQTVPVTNNQTASNPVHFAATQGIGDNQPTVTAPEPNQLPEELNGWNWGAFFLTWIWGIGNKSYIALLALLAPISLIIAIILGLKGNELAWQNRKFSSIEEFKAVQKRWAQWGVGLFVLSIVLTGVGIALSIAGVIKSGNYSYSYQIGSNSGSNTANSQSGAYANTAYGFSIQIPKGWQVDESHSTGEVVSLVNPTSDSSNGKDYAAYVDVNVESVPDPASLDTYVAATKSNLTDALTNFKVVAEKNITINGEGAKLIESTYTQGTYNLHELMLVYYLKDFGEGYIVNAVSLDSSWEKYKSLFESAVTSFNFPDMQAREADRSI